MKANFVWFQRREYSPAGHRAKKGCWILSEGVATLDERKTHPV